MAYIDADAILTAIRDVIEDGDGAARTISSTRFDGNFYVTLAPEAQSLRALVSTRAEADIKRVELSKHSPSQPSNVYIYDVEIDVTVVRHLNGAHKLVDATRDDVKALAVMDGDVLRQALCYPGNLTADNAGNATGLISGRLVCKGTEVGDVQLRDGQPGRISTVTTFSGQVRVESHPLDILDLAGPLVTYTGATEASYYTASPLVLRWQGASRLRYEYRPGSGNKPLIEGGRVNSLLHSETFSNVVWVSSGTTVTDNQYAPPDNEGVEADLLTNDGTSANHYIEQTASADNDDAVFSVFARKPDSNSASYIMLAMIGGDNAGVAFNLDTGAVVYSAYAIAATTATAGYFFTDVTELADGWRRYAVAFRTSLTASRTWRIQALDGIPASLTPTETSSSSMHIWGAQMTEPNPFTAPEPSVATSYIRTTTAAATRSSSYIDIPAANVPALMLTGAWEFDIYPTFSSASFMRTGAFVYVVPLYAFNNSGTGVADYVTLWGSSSAVTVRVVAGSSTRVDAPVSFSANGKVTIQLNPAAGTVTINGATTTGTAWTWPASQILRFGNVAVGSEAGANQRGFCGRFSNPRRTI